MCLTIRTKKFRSDPNKLRYVITLPICRVEFAMWYRWNCWWWSLKYIFVSHTKAMFDFERYQIAYDAVDLIETGALSELVADRITFGCRVQYNFNGSWQIKRLFMTLGNNILCCNFRNNNDTPLRSRGSAQGNIYCQHFYICRQTLNHTKLKRVI